MHKVSNSDHSGTGSKVIGPNLVCDLNRTPIYKWYVVRCDSKNGL